MKPRNQGHQLEDKREPRGPANLAQGPSTSPWMARGTISGWKQRIWERKKIPALLFKVSDLRQVSDLQSHGLRGSRSSDLSSQGLLHLRAPSLRQWGMSTATAGFQSSHQHMPASVSSGANYLTLQSLSFLICKAALPQRCSCCCDDAECIHVAGSAESQAQGWPGSSGHIQV